MITMSDEYLFALICKLKEFSLIKLNTNDCFLSTSSACLLFFIEDKYLGFAAQTWEIRIPCTAFSLYSSIEQTYFIQNYQQKLLTPVSPLWSVK